MGMYCMCISFLLTTLFNTSDTGFQILQQEGNSANFLANTILIRYFKTPLIQSPVEYKLINVVAVLKMSL